MNKEQYDSYKDFAEKTLRLDFKDLGLLITALTHRSYVNEHKKSTSEHNERLEFLGDAVLELATTDYLYRNYDENEGIMTNWRAALVRTESISDAGMKLGLLPLIRMSRGEKNGSERAHMVIVADAFEALIGAIYLDRGYKAAYKFISQHIIGNLGEVIDTESWRDPKSYAQELAQRIDGKTPSYHIIKEEGPDHEKSFTVALFVGNQKISTGTGHSKQEAESSAASVAIKKYKKLLKNNRKTK